MIYWKVTTTNTLATDRTKINDFNGIRFDWNLREIKYYWSVVNLSHSYCIMYIMGKSIQRWLITMGEGGGVAYNRGKFMWADWWAYDRGSYNRHFTVYRFKCKLEIRYSQITPRLVLAIAQRERITMLQTKIILFVEVLTALSVFKGTLS